MFDLDCFLTADSLPKPLTQLALLRPLPVHLTSVSFALPLIPVAQLITSACLINCEYSQDLDNLSDNVNDPCLFFDPDSCFAIDKL